MNIFTYLKGDKVIWAIVILLSIISVLVVYSSIVTLAYKYKAGDTSYYLVKHTLIIAMGVFLMYLTHNIKYTYYSRLSQLALFIAAPLLLFTFLKGESLNSASRWLEVPGTGLTFQSSDFAKLALIAYVARTLALKQKEITDFKKAFLPIVIPVVIICALILPANFSTAALLLLNCFVLMFIGRMRAKFMWLSVLVGIVCASIFLSWVWFAPDTIPGGRGLTWKKRIENFTKGEVGTDANYQVEQSKIAIATGGIIGKGPGKSTQRNFLPHPYSDFIFAIIIEEYGLALALVIILLYLIFLYRAIYIASKCEKTFGSLLTIGCCFMLVFQAMINMAVAVNLFPVTGQPLPLVSMGGTSIWFTSIAFGVILSVSRDLDPKPKNTETLETT